MPALGDNESHRARHQRQRGSTQPRIEPSEIADVSGRDLTLDKLLTFPKPAQCLARIAELRQVPGGEDDRQGKQEGEVPRPGHRNRMLEPWARLRPLASQQVDRAIGEVSPADCVCIQRRCHEPDRLGCGLGRFGESANFRKAQDQVATVVDRWRSSDSEILQTPPGR